jgi:hypothetical protein
MITELAVSCPSLVEPVTVTQSPVASFEAATEMDSVKDVVEVQSTVTWPLSWLCTSIDEAEICATDPDAPGKLPFPPPPERDPAGSEVVVEPLAV